MIILWGLNFEGLPTLFSLQRLQAAGSVWLPVVGFQSYQGPREEEIGIGQVKSATKLSVLAEIRLLDLHKGSLN